MKSLLLPLLVAPCFVFSQNYDVSLIPDSLKKDAKAVKRFEELKVFIKSPSRTVIKHKWAVTILNEEGRRFSGYAESYDKLSKINDIDGKLYDAAGKELKSVKKKDISDMSASDDMSLMTDNRMKVHNFYNNNYPYTVEYEDEQEYDGTFGFPRWMPVEDEKFSVQQSKLVVETPADYKLRYKQSATVKAPIVTNNAKNIVYQWELNNLSVMKDEVYQPDFDEIIPNVFIAPNKFEFGGYEGDMSTWEGFGKYISSLYVGRDVLPDNVKADIHKLTDGITDKNEKIIALYDYLQKNTRYISVQLGIGGLQPFPAKEVAAKKYGDCKALSNYMVSILKEAGIKANPVIIKAGSGKRGLWEDFPASYFNHVVMCIPDGKDTTWLECTDQSASAGYMGSFTGNRQALLLADDGGHVVRTPAYSKKENLQLRKINAVVSDDGNLALDVFTHFTGMQQELQHDLMHQATSKEREEYLNKVLSLPTYKIDKSEYKEKKGKIPVVDEYLKITASNYASVSGKRLFITPNLFNRSGRKLSSDEPRKYDIKFTYSYIDADTIHITVPAGYEAEALPKDVSLQTRFGNYSISYKFVGNSIDVLRVSEQNSGVFPAADYPALVKYFEDMYKADRSRVVLVKKEG